MLALEIVILISLICVGILSLIAPEAIWQIQHYLDTEGGKPTRFFLIQQRITGAILIVAAVVAIIMLIVAPDEKHIYVPNDNEVCICTGTDNSNCSCSSSNNETS